MSDASEQVKKLSVRQELELRIVQDRLRYREYFEKEATRNENENDTEEKGQQGQSGASIPPKRARSRREKHQQLSDEVLNFEFRYLDVRPNPLPWALAHTLYSILLAVEPDNASGEWSVVYSNHVKILYDTRLAFAVKEDDQVQIITQQCPYIMVDGKPRVVYQVHRCSYKHQNESPKSKDEGLSSNSLDRCVNSSREFHFEVHGVVVDRVGRVHDVCLAPFLDQGYSPASSSKIESTGGTNNISGTGRDDLQDRNVKIEKTSNVLKLPDWCSFYDGYYALDKATRESIYPNAGEGWTSRVDGARYKEPRFEKSATSLANMQYACRRTMQETGDRANVPFDTPSLPTFQVKVHRKLEISQESMDAINHLSRLAVPVREQGDIVQVHVIKIKDKGKPPRQSAAFVLDPRYWTGRFGGWFNKKVLRRD